MEENNQTTNLNEVHHAVILVNYNGVKDSLDCIKSIVKTVNFSQIKIILVDNASTQNETAVIKEKYPYVEIIKSDVNRGFSAGNNLGIKYALDKGFDYITLLNNDTVVAPDMFVCLEEYCSETVVAAPKMYYYAKPKVIWYGGGEINRITGNAKHTHMNCQDIYRENPCKCTFASGCCLTVKANIFRKVGLLEEDYFMYCEDTDFCIRLQLMGISIMYVPAAKLWHKVSSSTGGSNSPFSTYYLTRNRLNYIRKYNSFFGFEAYIFTLVSRVVRMLESKDADTKVAFKRGIIDHLKKIKGKVEFY